MHDIIYRTVQNYFHFFQPGDEEWGLNDFHLLELAFDLKLLDVNEVGEGLVDGVATLHVEDSRVKGDSVKNASTPDLKVFVVNLLVCREGVLNNLVHLAELFQIVHRDVTFVILKQILKFLRT